MLAGEYLIVLISQGLKSRQKRDLCAMEFDRDHNRLMSVMRNMRIALAGLLMAVISVTALASAFTVPAIASSSDSIFTTGVKETIAPNDAYYDKQWALPLINRYLDNVGTGEILVAILDSGIDVTHEDLAGKVKASVNFTGSRTDSDIQGHGTHVAGILAANINNGIGIAGMSNSIKLLNVKVCEDNGMVWPSSVAKGIIWAVDNGARVINMSFTIATDYPGLAEAVRYAADHNVVMMASAGNRIDSKAYPAAYPEVIAVAAINADGTLWSGSKPAGWIQAYVPGSEIYSTVPGNGYEYKSGSSMATAYASGVAAMILNGQVEQRDICPGCSEVRSALQALSRKLLK